MRSPKFVRVMAVLVGMATAASLGSCGGSSSVTSWSISGTLSGAVSQGVTVTLGGATSATATTDGAGRYAFAGLAEGDYTVRPSLAGYTFTPAVQSITLSGADVAGQDFAVTATPHAIAGTVSGLVNQGVTVTLGGASSATTTTDVVGRFSFAGLAGGSYTVTPSLAGYSFAPASRPVTVLDADVSGQDFVAAGMPYVVSGTVTGAVNQGVTVALGGARSGMATTDALGRYAFTGLPDGNYTVKASRSGNTFTPGIRFVAVSGADVAGQDFAAAVLLISGTVSGVAGQGVRLALPGSGLPNVVTGASGEYAFSGVADGSYAVTPSHTGYTFSPPVRSFTVSGADVAGLDFTGIPQACQASGSSCNDGNACTQDSCGSANVCVFSPMSGIIHTTTRCTASNGAVGHLVFYCIAGVGKVFCATGIS